MIPATLPSVIAPAYDGDLINATPQDDLVRHGLVGAAPRLPDPHRAVLALLACSRNGYVWSDAASQSYCRGNQTHERTRAAALIYQPGYNADVDRQSIESEITTLPSLRRVLRLDPPGAKPILDMLTDTGRDDESTGSVTPNGDPNCISYLAFTSGSTGAPKGVMHSDNTLLATARAIVVDWRIDATSVVYSMSPLSHNLGVGTLLTALLVGAEFVIHYLPKGSSMLDRLAVSLLGVEADAEDVVQETLVGAFRGLQGFREQASVKTWLTQILVRQAARHYRTERRHQSPRIAIRGLGTPDEVPRDGAEPQTASGQLRADLRMDLGDALRALPPEHREVIVLRYLEALSVREVAEVLGLRPNTVDVRLSRARKLLEPALADLIHGEHAQNSTNQTRKRGPV
jgi:RNA polymerase sigma factor (sigma-70 family)